MDNRLTGCPICRRLPQAEVRDAPVYQGRLFCQCGFSAPWADTITDAEALWNKCAQTSALNVLSLTKLFRSIGIAYSAYLQNPNEVTFMQFINSVETALEAASA